MYDPKHTLQTGEKKLTRLIWSALVGTVLFYVTFYEVLPLVGEDGIDKTDWIGLGVMIFVSLVCTVPWIFQSLLGDAVVVAKRRLGIRDEEG